MQRAIFFNVGETFKFKELCYIGRIDPFGNCENALFVYYRSRGWRVIKQDMTVRHLARQTLSERAAYVTPLTTRTSKLDIRQAYTPHSMLVLGICLSIGLVVVIMLVLLFFPARTVTPDETAICRPKLPVVRPPQETFRHWSQRVRSHAPGRVPSDPLCVICFDKILQEDQICGLDCLHIFHLKCFERLLEAGISKCPICQASLIKSQEHHDRTSGDSEFGSVEAFVTSTRIV